MKIKSCLFSRCVASGNWTLRRLTEEIILQVVHRRKEGRGLSGLAPHTFFSSWLESQGYWLSEIGWWHHTTLQCATVVLHHLTHLWCHDHNVLSPGEVGHYYKTLQWLSICHHQYYLMYGSVQVFVSTHVLLQPAFLSIDTSCELKGLTLRFGKSSTPLVDVSFWTKNDF